MRESEKAMAMRSTTDASSSKRHFCISGSPSASIAARERRAQRWPLEWALDQWPQARAREKGRIISKSPAKWLWFH
jgi:hypothetical protein